MAFLSPKAGVGRGRCCGGRGGLRAAPTPCRASSLPAEPCWPLPRWGMPFPAAKRPLILTAGNVPIGDIKLVGGYQGAALALSQPPVAAVVGTAAAAGDTVSVSGPCPGFGGKGRSRRPGSSKKWLQNGAKTPLGAGSKELLQGCPAATVFRDSPVGGVHRGASAPDAAEAAVPAVGEQGALPRDCLDHALQLQNAATGWQQPCGGTGGQGDRGQMDRGTRSHQHSVPRAAPAPCCTPSRAVSLTLLLPCTLTLLGVPA